MDIELIYFPIGGRGKAIRLIFETAKIPFKDTRVDGKTFGALCDAGELPLETLPVLKVGGKLLSSQSASIVRYAAELAGLQLTGGTAMARAEDVVATLDDISALGTKFYASSDEDVQKNGTDFIKSGFPFYARYIESILSNGQHDGPFVNESLSWVDIYVYSTLGPGTNFDDIVLSLGVSPAVVLAAFPKLTALLAAVGSIPAVAAHK
jgi:glutathione S-transferase